METLPDSSARHAGLEDLFAYPLTACLQDRRTRRVAQGVPLNLGDSVYESPNEPSPLSPLEEAVLIASTGVTGAVMLDGPLVKPSGRPELGSPFLHMTGRAGSSADNAQATSMFMVNDEAIWLLRRPQGREAVELMQGLPPRWEDRTEADWLAYADAVKVKVHDGRISLPREWPYYLGWNAQHSNVPGTTCFLPLVDNTRQYINVLLILLEPKGTAPLFMDDWRPFRPKQATEWIAWAASKLGFVDPIPYQPIGGLKWLRNGFATAETPAPLGAIGTVRTDHEAFFLLQNLMLTGEALRLGGWVHGAPMAPHVMRRDEAKGLLGLGFREHSYKPSSSRWRRWPPVPASQPNFVGIDGVLEGLCPPYVTDMDAAVDAVIEEKYGPNGTYTDTDTFARAYRDRAAAEAYLRHAEPHSKETIAYTKEICRYLVETYGRFPAHTDAFHLPGIWVQFSHLEIEYYERFAAPGHARRQAEGRELWGRT
ncbi:MAG TPA: hypothetical protein VFB35_00150 [Gaiellaceae bacterium]|nr:hypothetical protein [Gaiellaceae bacterium]